MKIIRMLGFAIVMSFIFSMAFSAVCCHDNDGANIHDEAIAQTEGTRQGFVGWQHASFDENLEVDYAPVNPKPTDPIRITIRSLEPDVTIQMAYVDITVTYPQGGVATGGRTFLRVTETEMKCLIGPYDVNGTTVAFFINAYDYNNVPMQSPVYTINVMGEERTGGWNRLTFDDNIKLTQTPVSPNASEAVNIIIESRDSIPIEGANLYFLYKPIGGAVESGGWAFDRVNMTTMEREIPANFHPAGANISYWIVAWDEYSNLTKSEPMNYSVPGIVLFNYPFEYTIKEPNGDVDNSKWYPDNITLFSLAGIGIIMIPLLAYLKSEENKKMKKKDDLIIKEKDKEILGGIKEEEIEPDKDDDPETDEEGSI